MQFDTSEHPHRRYNPLTGEWILVSPQRTKRPWRGGSEDSTGIVFPEYDSACALCPGNTRASGDTNPQYQHTHVFRNDFAALEIQSPIPPANANPLFQLQSARGESHVLCFSPQHHKTLAELSSSAIEFIVQAWADISQELSAKYAWVQIFENKGEMMGCSQPHPHGQIWATEYAPNEVKKKDRHLKHYFDANGTNLLIDYIEAELASGDRVVVNTDHWLAVVPYWASWPFETLLLPKNEARSLGSMSPAIRADLAVALKELTCRYDNLFQCSFPYSMGWHCAPFDQALVDHWQLHATFYPPLLRSESVRKFMVGYEMFAEPQRDLTPESAADRLRGVSAVHFKESL